MANPTRSPRPRWSIYVPQCRQKRRTPEKSSFIPPRALLCTFAGSESWSNSSLLSVTVSSLLSNQSSPPVANILSSDSDNHETVKAPIDEEKDVGNHVEEIHSNERVPGHRGYYEKDGLRTYGDDEDHDHEPPWATKRILALVAQAFLWTGSQIPVYLLSGITPYIYSDIGAVDRWIWLVLAYLLTLAAICPFVGSLSDLIGRRYVSLLGSVLLIVAMIITGTDEDMDTFIAGMGISGVGAGICKLNSLTVTSELAPTRKRGIYVAILVFTIVPFCPSVLYGQLIACHSTWRYCTLLSGIWAAIGFFGTLFFYSLLREIIGEIDLIGGFLSISGLILFLAGFQWGGYQFKWSSAHVLVPLILGALLVFVVFPIWEIKFAEFPMFPSRMKQEARIFTMTLIITAISGANFFSILMFWPTQAFNVYGHDPVEIGLRTLPIGFAILTDCVIVLWLLSVFRGNNRELLIVSSCFMTAGCGAMYMAKRDNIQALWAILIIAGLGIGGIIVPAAVMTTIICPDDIITTVTALTLSIRVIGGCIGYTVYYNVFVNKYVPNIIKYLGGAMVTDLGIPNQTYIAEAIGYTSAALLPLLKTIPDIGDNETAYDIAVLAGQIAYQESYKWVYLVSIAFGGISILASCFLGNINKYMDDHVAVVMS